MPYVLLSAVAVLFFCWRTLSVNLDPREPPLVKPKMPYIWHLVGMITESTSYYDRMSKMYPPPIFTMPIFNSKTYIIQAPALVQSAFRNKNLSFEPFMAEFAQRMLGVSNKTMAPSLTPATETRPSFMDEAHKVIHESLNGPPLQKMNTDMLNTLSVSFNELGDSFQPESLFLWLRTMMTMATADTLFGTHNPLKDEPSPSDALWDFEAKIIYLIVNPFAKYFLPNAYNGRAALQSALSKFYVAKHDSDPDVGTIMKAHAKSLRSYGMPDSDIGKIELSILQVSTTNAIPTTFWHLMFVLSDPALTELIREELLTVITINHKGVKRGVNFDISKFASHCPLFVSSYGENIRLSNSAIGSRRVIQDTTITDGKPTYLLRKGANIQMPTSVAHYNTEIWAEKDSDRTQKKAYFPFGGGKHLCPGRNFAFAEILGTVAIMVLGFEVRGVDGEVLKVPVMGRSGVGEGIAKPGEDGVKMSAVLKRRKGWEGVTWGFAVVDKE
ncbi:cytochrome P450 [Amylocarpus encephaloides]|uniref:Cytochrome P450 n=1 Tax=Amylocarpus encephaloides TaxID=45428 RepID=A0A9P7YB94_9HELO|nr:cytochrome P450 [Amylocarpus encephaloides]